MLAEGRNGTAALDVRALTKRYDDGTIALDALDLTIPGGAFFGLLGPNGAGKTTLINSVTGLVRVTAGSIKVFGHGAGGGGPGSPAARASGGRGRRPRAPRRPGVRGARPAGRQSRSLPDRLRVSALPRGLLRDAASRG